MNTMELLVTQAKQLDKDAFSKLYQTVYKELYQMVYYTLGNEEDAKDVVSDTILAAYESLSKLRDPSCFKAWIFKIAINKCNKKIRHYLKREQELRDDILAKPLDLIQTLALKEAMGQLSYDERLILSLYVFGGYKGEEISEMLHLKHTTIRSKYHRSLKKLKHYLEQ